ncbi:MAG: Alanine aminotransferase, partial [Streblomastix strix]
MYKPTFTVDGIQPNVLHENYVVSGAVPQRAMEIEEELKQGVKYPFSKIIYCNIGNPHVLGQQPISFFREVLSLLANPALLNHPNLSKIYNADVIKRARYMLQETPGGVGAYSHSQGLPFVRKDIAAFIEKRDGFPCSLNTIFLSQGASPGIQTFLQFLI